MKLTKPNITKKDVIYILIIINILVWSIAVFKTKTFYNDYVNLLINQARAEVTESQKSESTITQLELSVKDFVLLEIKKAKLDVVEAEMIIKCESNWNQYAVNANTNKTYDAGLWQINSIHKIDNSCKFDYKCSTKWAIEKRLHDGNWNAWVCSKLLHI